MIFPCIYTTGLAEDDLYPDDPTLERWTEVLGSLFCISIPCTNSHKIHMCHRKLHQGRRGLGCRGGGMLPTSGGLPAEEGTWPLLWALPSSPPALWTRLLAITGRGACVLGQCLVKEKLIPESSGLWARFGPGLSEAISRKALLMSSVLYRCSWVVPAHVYF